MSKEQYCTVRDTVTLAYKLDGPPQGKPVLLIAGLGIDLNSWPQNFIDGLVELGHLVIRFDNRDSGRSSRIAVRPPHQLRQVLGISKPRDYTLEDMSDDTAKLLEKLGFDSVHVVGMSMGGMIGQTLTAKYPEKVRTLTSIFSTTGSRRVGQPAISTMLKMLGPAPQNEMEFVAAHLRMTKHIGGRDRPHERLEEVDRARHMWRWVHDRYPGDDATGEARQIGAIRKSGDRTKALTTITSPTLVIHGDRDLMVAPSGGKATAAAIPNSTHVTIRGMRHHLPKELSPKLLQLIRSHINNDV